MATVSVLAQATRTCAQVCVLCLSLWLCAAPVRLSVQSRCSRTGGSVSSGRAKAVHKHSGSSLWDPAIVRQIRSQLVMPDSQPIRAICFDPTGSRIAIGTNSRTLKVCSVPTPLTRARGDQESGDRGYLGKLSTQFEWTGCVSCLCSVVAVGGC